MGIFRKKTVTPTAPQTLELDGVEYRQQSAWSPDPENFFHLYLPPDEDPALFRRRLQLDVHTTRRLTAGTVIQHWIPLHASRHDGPAEMNHQVFGSNDGSGEYVLDFLLSHHEASLPAWEWNVVRVSPQALGHVVFAQTLRAYGEEIGPFLDGLVESRISLLGRFMEAPVPTVST